MINKKSQLKIQEMAFMLVAIILFFILVGLFVVSIVYKNLQDSAVQIKEEATLSAIENLAGTAEFVCTGSKSNCVDADKLMALIGRKSYESFWDFSSLSVLKYSGFNKNESDFIECNIQNYPNCDVFNIYDKSRLLEKDEGKRVSENVIHSFVALCRREYEQSPYEKCEIAQLWAGTKRK